MTAALAAGALLCASAAPATASPPTYFPEGEAEGIPSVTLAVLPSTYDLEDLTHVRGLALGLMSAGIGDVSSEQMFLDITQANRVNSELYDTPLPPLGPFGTQVPDWKAIDDRAHSVPAQLDPGLLAGNLGFPVRADPHLIEPALLAATYSGAVRRLERPGCSYKRRCPGLVVIPATRPKLVGLAMGLGNRGLEGRDLLIAITEPDADGVSAIGIGAPTYFHSLRADTTRWLTSDSTRTDGLVLSTDLARTIWGRFGDSDSFPLGVEGGLIRPGPITSRAAVVERAKRLEEVPDRRAPVVILCLLAWLAVALTVNRIVFGLRRVSIAWLALSFAYMPLMLLIGAWIEPSAIGEGLLVGIGAAGLSALTVRFAWGWRGLAIACAITVIAYAIDVIAGSGLTQLSLLGPNPLYGARFYGIGNELEALFAVMVPVGVGAGLSAWRQSGKAITERRAMLAFLVAGLLATLVFAAGRFGADVGAAIVLPLGAAVSAVALKADSVHLTPNTAVNRTKPSSRRVAVAIIGTPFIALLLLALIDLVSGGNAHLTRSIFDAGGATDLADVAERRLRLSAHDFGQAAGNPLFWLVVAGIGVAVSQWRRIDAWFEPAPIARAGLLGACAAVAVGVLVNDSGATFLALGALALGAVLAYTWSQSGRIRAPGTGDQ